MYRVNDKVYFHVDWMRPPAVGYVEDISGTMARCRLSVPLRGHTHVSIRIDQLKPTEELKEQREKERVSGITETLTKQTSNNIDDLVKEILNAKKVRL